MAELTKGLAQSAGHRQAPLIFGIVLTVSLFAGDIDSASAQSGIPLWTNRYDGPASGDDRATAIAVDADRNVVVAGSSTALNGRLDYTIVKYSSVGVALWTNRYNGPADLEDWVAALAVDSSGNVLVTGGSGNGTNEDFATIKYSPGGIALWTNRYNGPLNGADYPRSLAVDRTGNVFVAGASYNPASIFDYVVIKYSGAGVSLWTNRYNGTGNDFDEANAVAITASGDVVTTGTSKGSNSYEDYITIKYSNVGIPLWTNRYDGTAGDVDEAYALGVDGSGNVFITGRSWGGFESGYDYATVKYSSSGATLWTRRYNGPESGSDEAYALAVDPDGNVAVTGLSDTIRYSGAGTPLWTNRFLNLGAANLWPANAVDRGGNVIVVGQVSSDSFPFHFDYAAIMYSREGASLWTNRYNGPAAYNDSAHAVAVDSLGNIYVTGYSFGSDSDFATIKYSSAPLSPIALHYQSVGNQLVLSWTNAAFGLQTAPIITGVFTNIPGAASPFTNALPGVQRYFRLNTD